MVAVVTGGPGAGKTAVVELARRALCRHVAVVPEAATIVFSGGFPRGDEQVERRAAQRAIFHIQHEMESLVRGREDIAMIICDRGTVDGLAYWPGDPDELWAAVGTSLSEQLARYDLVIHLETPSSKGGYNNSNPVRIESACEASRVGRKIAAAWSEHPAVQVIPSRVDFAEKALAAVRLIKRAVPDCCTEY